MTLDSPLVAEFVATGRCDACPVINVHSHAGPFPGIYMPHADPERMVRSLRRAGCRVSLLASHQGLYEVDGGNEITAGLVTRFPDDLRGLWAVNPNYPDHIAAALEQLPGREEFIGFKFWPGYHQYPFDGPKNRPVLEYAAERGMPCLVHTWGHDPNNGPDNIRRVAERYPDLPLLAAHSFSGQWDEAIRIGSEYPNVFLDLTGVERHNGLVQRFVEGAGSEKVLFGTDAPWFSPYYPLGCVLFARISDEDRHNVLHRNAERLLAPWLPVSDSPA